MLKVLRIIAALFLVAIAGLGIEYVEAVTGGLISGNAQIASINGDTGAFTTGAGLSSNVNFIATYPPSQVAFTKRNVMAEPSGQANVLTNSTMSSWWHTKLMTKNNPATTPYHLDLTSITASIDNGTPGTPGFRLEVTAATSGTGSAPNLFQRVTDEFQLVTTAPTSPGSWTGSTANCSTALASCTLSFASTTGVQAGMHVYDVDNPRAISGAIRVASTTSTTVVLTEPVGYQGNTHTSGTRGSPGVASGDHISFGMVARGTSIVGYGTCGSAVPPTYPCYYDIDTSQSVSSEAMQTAGGWSADQVYAIPSGTAGGSNYANCANSGTSSATYGSRNPAVVTCAIVGGLNDFVIRFPVDATNALRINCSDYTGPATMCVSAWTWIQPITFTISVLWTKQPTQAPTLVTRNSCPLVEPNQPAGSANICAEDWTNGTADIGPVTLPSCNTTAAGVTPPVHCIYSYVWTPTGITGNMEIEFHTGPVADTQGIILAGFEAKYTPGATCTDATTGVVSQPPCYNAYPPPIETPDVASDLGRSSRFQQAWGRVRQTGWNAGNLGPIESVTGWAQDTTTFVFTWPLPVTMRCDIWHMSSLNAAPCKRPNFYVSTPGDLTFNWVSAGTSLAQATASSISVQKYGQDSVQLAATTTGLIRGGVGSVNWAGIDAIILYDASDHGD